MSIATGIIARFKHPIIVMCITLAACLFILATYMHGSLQGNFNHFFMPAEKFGIPNELKARGLTEMYKGPIETGWDGQFYYYISNDILANKDTLEHIDSSAYRYQRIGLPLAAKIISKVTGQSWVSPLTYYLTDLLLILIAAGSAATFFQQRKINPYFILFWSIGCGTQVTLLHGLPDGAADAFLIIALICLFKNYRLLYMVAVTFAALSREVYVLLPGFIMLATFLYGLSALRTTSQRLTNIMGQICQQSWIHLLPILIFISWQITIRIKFGVSPSAQAGNILGLPFASALHYINACLHGVHPQIGAAREAYLEGIGLILFLILLFINAIFLIRLLVQSNPLSEKKSASSSITCGVALTFLTLIGMYCCFGPIVIMRYSGYFKAANIFVFMIPFIACLTQRQLNRFIIFFLIIITVFFDYLLWESVSEPPYHPMPVINYVKTEPACLKSYKAKIVPISIEETPTNGLIKRLLVKRTTVINVKVTNQSDQAFSPYPGKGTVNVSYQWINATTSNVVRDGTRTTLSNTLAPNQTTVVPLYVTFPSSTGEYLLKLSLVQEGCSWFYIANPNSAFTIPYIVR